MTSISLTNIEVMLEDSRSPWLGSGWVGATYKMPLALTPANGFVPQAWNPGFPEVREVSSKRPATNGTFDSTQYFGARAVTLQVAIARELQSDPTVTDQMLQEQLTSWMDPSLRVYLSIRFDSKEEWRRILLRSADAGGSLQFLTRADFRSPILSWKAVDGFFESTTYKTQTLGIGSTSETGRTYDQSYDKTYPASLVIGAKPVVNDINGLAVDPFVRIFGPCTQPRIENQTTGLKLEFLAAFALTAGQYLDIDFREGTVLLNGDPTNSRYDKIDFATGVSSWWNLIPGVNSIRYYPLSASDPSHAEVQWRYRYI